MQDRLQSALDKEQSALDHEQCGPSTEVSEHSTIAEIDTYGTVCRRPLVVLMLLILVSGSAHLI